MGCDIHYVLEFKMGDKWVGFLSDRGQSYKVPAGARSYVFFTELANVRGESDTAMAPKGLPDDISDLTRSDLDIWYHSHSWCSVEEYLDAYNRAAEKVGALPIKEKAELFGLAYWPFDEFDEYNETRVVFGFDN